jgi:hypothetical protein
LSFKREEHFRRRPFPKQNIDKLFLCHGHLVWRALVRRQVANQLQNNRHVFHVCRTNSKIIAPRHSAADSPPPANGRNWSELLPSSLFFSKKEAERLDIRFTAQLASVPPLAGYEKADSAFRYGAPNSRRVLPAFAT